MTAIDVAVVGSGPAGLVVADALARAGRSVVLIEAGPGVPLPPALTAVDVVGASRESSRFWPGLEVQDRASAPPRSYRQARTFGGGSMVNGMVLSRGAAADYDFWAAQWGATGWGADRMIPWLDRAAGSAHTTRVAPGSLSATVQELARGDGLTSGGSTLDLDAEGILQPAVTVRDQRRVTGFDLCPEAAKAQLLTGTAAVRLRLVGDRLVGVELDTGTTIDVPQVVLCAGALGTPAILARSGLGPNDGFPLRDHPSVAFDVAAHRSESSPVLAGSRSSVGSVIRFGSSADRAPDIEVTTVDIQSGAETDRARASNALPDSPSTGSTSGSVIVALLQPQSVGRLTAAANGPGTSVRAVLNLLDDRGDRHAFRSGVRRVAAWLAAGPVPAALGSVAAGDIGLLGDDDLDRLLLTAERPVAHLAGTCPLGPSLRPESICDFEPGRAGALRGVTGVRIADSAVLPGLVSGGLQLPVMAVAARIAADLVSA